MSFVTHSPVLPQSWGKGRSQRELAEEVAVAIVVNGSTLAVMMATPADLEAFGVGFALTEGVIAQASEIERVEVVDHELGIEVRLWVGAEKARTLAARRRQQAGPTGCGLCGIDSLEEAMRGVRPVRSRLQLSPEEVQAAVASLRPVQSLNAVTRSVHAAALWHRRDGVLAVCEDVGRHNALDKLAGRAAQMNLDVAECAVLLTSRVSIELVQKTAMLGAPVLIAVSAPTRLAVDMAREAGITLIGVAREDGFEVFTRPS
jgi:FdhD protein